MSVIERAQQEAERRPAPRSSDLLPSDYVEIGQGVGFVQGATFAATIAAEQIEAAARALAEHDGRLWSVASEKDREQYRKYVRAAFVAAGFEVTR